MKYKFLIIVFLILFILTGCKMNQDDGKTRIYLSDKYYNNGNFIDVNKDDLSDNETYVLYIYNNYCNFQIPCDEIFKKFMEKYNIDFLSMPFKDFKNTSFYDYVKYAPSVIIISDGKIISYLDANSDDDLSKYQDEKEFELWLDKYIYFRKSSNN